MARYLSWALTQQYTLADDVREHSVSVCQLPDTHIMWNTVTGELFMLRAGYVYEVRWWNDDVNGYESYKGE